MPRTAVLVPGMLGSILEKYDFYGGVQTLWGEGLTAKKMAEPKCGIAEDSKLITRDRALL